MQREMLGQVDCVGINTQEGVVSNSLWLPVPLRNDSHWAESKVVDVGYVVVWQHDPLPLLDHLQYLLLQEG